LRRLLRVVTGRKAVEHRVNHHPGLAGALRVAKHDWEEAVRAQRLQSELADGSQVDHFGSGIGGGHWPKPSQALVPERVVLAGAVAALDGPGRQDGGQITVRERAVDRLRGRTGYGIGWIGIPLTGVGSMPRMALASCIRRLSDVIYRPLLADAPETAMTTEKVTNPGGVAWHRSEFHTLTTGVDDVCGVGTRLVCYTVAELTGCPLS
jgi:hypothetical protein